MQKQVSKSMLRARTLELLRKVASSGEPLIVTAHGIPTIEIRRYEKAGRNPLDTLKDSVTDYSMPTDPVADHDWEVNG